MVRICQCCPSWWGDGGVVHACLSWEMTTRDLRPVSTSWYFMILPTARATMVPSKKWHTTHTTHATKEVASQPLTRWVNPGQPNTPLTHAPTFDEARLWWLLRQRNVQAEHHSSKFTRSQNVTDWCQSRMRLSENWNFEPKYDGGRARWLPNSSKLYNDYAPENILGWITGVQDNNPMLASPVERTHHFQPMDFCPSKVATPFFRPACRKFKARWARWLSLAPAFQLHQLSKWSTALANDGPWNLITIKFVDDMVIQNFQLLKM